MATPRFANPIVQTIYQVIERAVPGPQGPQGIQGVAGPQGPAGSSGTSGSGVYYTSYTAGAQYNGGTTPTTASMSASGTVLTATVNGVPASVDLAGILASGTTNILTTSTSTNSFTLTSTVNGIVSTTTANFINQNALTSAVNTLTSVVNGVTSTSSLINSNTLSANSGVITSTVNGVTATTSISSLYNFLASSTNNNLTVVTDTLGNVTYIFTDNPIFGSATITNAVLTNTTATNLVTTNSTSTNLFSTNASITNATTSNFFTNLFSALSAYISNLLFDNATGTNITATGTANLATVNSNNITTSNLTATGTTNLATTTVSGGLTTSGPNTLNGSTTVQDITGTNATFTNLAAGTTTISGPLTATNTTLSGTTTFNGVVDLSNASVTMPANATFTNIVWGNATGTNTYTQNLTADNATLTNATSTNFFASVLSALSAFIDNLLFNNATGTNITATGTANLANIVGNTASITSATITNLSVPVSATTSGNVLTTNIGGSVATSAVITSNALTSSGATITSSVNGVSSSVDLTNVIASGTTVSSTFSSTTNQLVTTVNGKVATATVDGLTNANLLGTTSAATITAGQVDTNGLTATNATITNATTSNFFTSLLSVVTGYIQNLFFDNATGTNITATGTANLANVISNNATITNISGTNSNVTNATNTNLFSTNASITNATISNLAVDNISVPNTLSSAGNVITSNIGGSIATTTAVNSNTISTTTNTFISIVNGVSSAVVNFINSLTQSAIGNTLTTTINGVVATSSIITNNTLSISTSTNSFVLTSDTNGVISTTTANFINSNDLSSTVNTLTSVINGVSSSTSIINSNTLAANSGVITSTINGIVATTSVSNLLNFFASSTNSNLTVATDTAGNVTYSFTSNPIFDSVTATTSTFLNSAITNATVTNATTSNLFANVFSAISGFISNLIFDNATGTNITATGTANLANIVGTNSNVTNATNTNLVASNATFTNVSLPFSQSATGNTLTTNVAGSVATSSIITSNALSASGTVLTTTINGVATSTDLQSVINNGTTNVLTVSTTTNSFELTSIVNGKVATTTANFINQNALTSAVNTLTSVVNGVTSTSSLINSNTLSANSGVITSTVNGVTATTSISSLYNFLASSTNNNLTVATDTLGNVTYIFTDNPIFGSATITNAVLTNATATNLIATNATSTNFFTSILNAVTGFISSLWFDNATGTNITATGTANLANIISNNATITNLAVTGNANLGTVASGTATNTLLVNDGSGNIRQINSAELLASNTTNTLTNASSTNSILLTNTTNGVVATTSFDLVNSNSVAAASGVITTNINGVVATTSIANLYTFLASSTNQNLTVATDTAGNVTYLLTDNPIFTNATTTNLNTTNITGTNATLTNATSTNLFASVLSALSAFIDSLLFNNATGTNIAATGTANLANIISNNATITNISGTNSDVTNATNTNLVATNATFTNISVPNTLSSAGNVVTSNIGGSISTTSIINSNALSASGTVLTTTINGVATSTDLQSIINAGTSHMLTISTTTNNFTLTSIVNGVVATTTANFVNANSLSAAANILTSTVNGVISTSTIITSNVASSSLNMFEVIVNGVTSGLANIINSFTQSASGNVLASTINGVTATSSIITNNTLSVSTSTNSFTLTSDINGVISTTTANFINSNDLSSTVNTLTSVINGVSSSTSIINSSTLAANSGVITSTINGVVATTSVSNLLNFFASSTNSNLTVATDTAGNVTYSFTSNPIFDSVTAATGTITNLFGTNSNVTNATNTNLVATNATFTNLSVPNTLFSAGNVVTSNIGGSISTTTAVNSNTLSFATSTSLLTSIVNGLTSTTSLADLACQITGNFFCDGGNARGTDLTIGTNDNFAQIFETNNAERMRLTSAGELIYGNTPAPFFGGLGFTLRNAGMVSMNGVHQFYNAGGTQMVNIDPNQTFGYTIGSVVPAAASTTLDVFRGGSGTLSGPTSYIRGDGSAYFGGRVGVGTTVPGNALHIASSSGSVSGLRLGISSSTATTTASGKVLSVDGNGDVILVDGTTGSLVAANNGLTATGSTVQLGGGLLQNTTISNSTVGSGDLITMSNSVSGLTGSILNITSNQTAAPNGLLRVGAAGLTGFNAAQLVSLNSSAGIGLAVSGGNSYTGAGLVRVSSTGITTGTGIEMLSTNNALNSTLGLLNISNTGTSTSGRLATFRANSVATSGMFILTNGNTGFGTTSPLNQVHIASSTGAISGLRLGLTSATSAGSNSGKVLSVDTNGDVVLVNSTPSSASFETITVSSSTATKVATFTGDIDVTGTIDPTRILFSNLAGVNSPTWNPSANSNNYKIEFAEGGNLNFGSASTSNILQLMNDGKVGVGTVDPYEKLHVAGAIRAGDLSSTNGSLIIAGNYSSPASGYLTTFGSEYSSGAPVIGYGVRTSTTTSGAFTSMVPTALSRSAVTVSADVKFYTSPSQTVALGGSIATMTEKMVLTNAGNLGIGTNTPARKLSVYDTGAVFAGLFTSATGNAAQLQINRGGLNDTYIGPTGGNELHFWTYENIPTVFGNNNTEKMRILANGNVGIGTNVPANKLEITHGTAGNSGLRFTNLLSTSATSTGNGKALSVNPSGDVILVDSTAATPLYIGATATTSGITGTVPAAAAGDDQYVLQGNGNWSSVASILSVANGLSYNSISDRIELGGTLLADTDVALNNSNMTFSGLGSFGIGTLTPSRKLEVADTGDTLIRINSASSTGTSQVQFSRGSANTYFGPSPAGIDFYSTENLPFNFANNGTLKMYIGTNGNVGIGTNNPGGYKLAVDGSNPAGRVYARIDNTSGVSASSELDLGATTGKGWSILNDRNANGGDNFSIYHAASNTYPFMIDSTDNVGIGTFAPGNALHVASSSNSVSGLRLGLNSGTAALSNTGKVLSVNASGDVVLVNSTPSSASFETLTVSSSTAAKVATFTGDIDVTGTIDPTRILFSNLAGVNSPTYNPSANGNNYSMDFTDGGLNFKSNAANNILQLNNNGNVGIGIANPIVKMQVNGDFSYGGDASNIHVYGSNNATDAWLDFKQNSSTVGANIGYDFANGRMFINTGGTDNTIMNTGGGNVGIGTITPARKLSVYDTGAVFAGLFTSATGNAAQLQINRGGLNDTYIGPTGGNELHFWTYENIPTVFGNNNTEKMRILANGRVGIGTNAPAFKTEIVTGGYNDGLHIKDPTNTVFGGLFVESGRLHLVTRSNHTLSLGTNDSSKVNIYNTGGVQFSSYGAGTLTTDGAGNITASSDERLKNIDTQFTRGLEDIKKISPITYHWNSTSGLDQTQAYSGFSAQNVQSAIPEAVDTDPRGYLTLSDRPVIAALVNAVKEIAERIENFAKEFTTEKLCVGTQADRECITKDELRSLKNGSTVVPSAPAAPTTWSAPTATDTPVTATPTTPVTEVPATEEPAPAETPAPAAEAPAPETPATEAPATETPVVTP